MSIGNHLEEAKMLSRLAYPGALSLDSPENGPLGSRLPTSLLLDQGLAPVPLGRTVMARDLRDTGFPPPPSPTPALATDGRFRTL